MCYASVAFSIGAGKELPVRYGTVRYAAVRFRSGPRLIDLCRSTDGCIEEEEEGLRGSIVKPGRDPFSRGLFFSCPPSSLPPAAIRPRNSSPYHLPIGRSNEVETTDRSSIVSIEKLRWQRWTRLGREVGGWMNRWVGGWMGFT